jgi:hypothetical protein
MDRFAIDFEAARAVGHEAFALSSTNYEGRIH